MGKNEKKKEKKREKESMKKEHNELEGVEEMNVVIS